MFETIQSLLGFAIFFFLLEYAFPAQKNKKLVRKDSKLDLAYSFLLPLLYIPVQIFGVSFVGLYFYGAVGMAPGQTTQPITTTILQKATHGKVTVLKNGSIHYQPGRDYAGFDFFIIKKSDGENSLVQTMVVKPVALEKEETSSIGDPKQISIFVTSSVPGGKIAQGFTGWFLSARNLIQGQSLLMQIFLAIVVVDFAGYWRHRFMHSKFLWPFHTIHHSSKQVDWLSTERFHPVNHYITAFLNLIILTALFADPYVSATAMSLRRKYGLFIHSNIRLSYGFLNFVFASPLFHRWHHSDSETAFNKNYSTFFSLFDLMFGTFYLPMDKKDPESFGFYGGTLEKGLIGQTIYPFLKLAEMSKKT
mgnify:CR=1 FL=1|jgi:sterol desaturase/sphingolipid hydroxylase (fatty acid hydroxylase superfamily)